MKLLDCTLRDGGNVVGNGFDAGMTRMMIEGLISSGIRTIEFGNCKGLGAYEKMNAVAPCTDREYLETVRPYLDRGEIGMFMLAANADREGISMAADYGLSFLRVAANAGDGNRALEVIRWVKEAGLKCRYSLMKAYLLSAEELADEAFMLQEAGLDEVTVMDSAGTMTPGETERYCRGMTEKLHIPVAFHGHNNLGLSVANTLAAYRGGASVFDCGLLGMARSAGNCPTELAVAVFQKEGFLGDADLLALLAFEDEQLIPAMKTWGYHTAVTPFDLILGLAGAHSSYAAMFRQVAEEKGVSLYRLILEVSRINRKDPNRALAEQVADKINSLS